MGKKHRSSAKEPQPETDHNPADEGLDHSVRQGTEKDIEESYIDKQEARSGRGEDNEDSTDESGEAC